MGKGLKSYLALLLAMLLAMSMMLPAWAEAPQEEALDDAAAEEEIEYPDELRVGHPTITKGDFFTEMFGNDTADIDVRALIHGYNLVNWDQSQGVYLIDESVVQNVLVLENDLGDRTYYFGLYDDLCYNDGTPITAWDYAFSLLLMMSKEVEQIGGKIYRSEHILGSHEYLTGEKNYLSGVGVLDDYQLVITLDHNFLPYFFETGLFLCVPYPIQEIAPGCKVYAGAEEDLGNGYGYGIYIGNEDPSITEPIYTAELLQKTIMDPETGYNSHPKVTCGPYTLVDYDYQTAHFEINPYFKGAWLYNTLPENFRFDVANKEGVGSGVVTNSHSGPNIIEVEREDEEGNPNPMYLVLPTIEKISFSLADNDTMAQDLIDGTFHLINKVTYGPTILECLGANGASAEALMPGAEEEEAAEAPEGEAAEGEEAEAVEAEEASEEGEAAEEASEEGEAADTAEEAEEIETEAAAAAEEPAEEEAEEAEPVAEDEEAEAAEEPVADEEEAAAEEDEEAAADEEAAEGEEEEEDASGGDVIRFQNYPRIGLAFLTFTYDWPTVHDKEVRQAMAWCMDRDAMTQEYTSGFGLVVNGYYGIEQWEYLICTGQLEYPINFITDETHTDEDLEEWAKHKNMYATTEEEYEDLVAAWEMLSLDNLTNYNVYDLENDPDREEKVGIDKANALLDSAKWTLNRNGEPYDPEKDDVRCKMIDDQLVALDLTMMYPEGNHMVEIMEDNFFANLKEVGIKITPVPAKMEDLLRSYYREDERTTDMIYLATNFHVIVDPSITYSTDPTPDHEIWKTTYSDDEDLWYRAVNMRQTDPRDVFDYVSKWISFQERYNEVLPTIPIYSNIYFDFYTPQLQNYYITAHVTWSQAILQSYFGEDLEPLPEEETGEEDGEFEEFE